VWAKLSAFWRWWTTELGSLLPALDQREAVNRKTLSEVALMDRQAWLHQHQRLKSRLNDPVSTMPTTAITQLFGQEKRTRDVVVSFDPDNYFARTYSIPASALPQADQILALDLNRLVPLPASDLFTTWFPSGRSKGTVELTQIAVRKAQIKGLSDQLASKRIRIAGFAFRDAEGQALPLVIDADGQKIGSYAERFWRSTAAVCLIAFLAASASLLWLGFFKQSSAIAQVQQATESLRSKASDIRKQIEVMRSRNDEVAQLIKLRTTSADVPAIWNELARILPDDAWLSTFSMRGGIVSIDGQASNAEQLISIVGSSARFRNPRFTAPLVNDQRTRQSRFSMTFDLESDTQ
jgi:general secretion pathway protein L